MLRLLSFVLLLPLATQVHAQARTDASFTIQIAGITIGSMSLKGVENGTGYSVSAAVDSVGAARVFRRFSYRASSRGNVSGGRFTPVRYAEIADTGRRVSDAILNYSRGVPRIQSYTAPVPANAPTLSPATQGGTLDPLTAMYALLRDQPAATLCNTRVTLFDGRRRSTAVLGPPRQVSGGIACSGEYRRLEGYSPEELARHRAFPMTFVYRQAPSGLMQVARVELQSIYGAAAVVRR